MKLYQVGLRRFRNGNTSEEKVMNVPVPCDRCGRSVEVEDGSPEQDLLQAVVDGQAVGFFCADCLVLCEQSIDKTKVN